MVTKITNISSLLQDKTIKEAVLNIEVEDTGIEKMLLLLNDYDNLIRRIKEGRT